MSSKYEAGSRLVWSLAVVSLAAVCLWFGADFNTAKAKGKDARPSTSALGPGTVIPGTGTGAIPDGPGVPTTCGSPGANLDIAFDASGVSGTVADISLDMNATHTWVGDITATLIAPDLTSHVIFGATGSTAAAGCGSADDLGGLYAFSDTGSPDWWAQGSPYPAGNYRTTEAGGSPGSTGAATDFAAAFSGVSATGTWTLRVTDGGAGDTGSISASNLTLVTAGGPTLNGDTDFDGDGITDYSVVRDMSPPLQGTRGTGASLNEAYEKQLAANGSTRRGFDDGQKSAVENLGGAPAPGGTLGWFVANSGTPGTFQIEAFGTPNDQLTPADFDGDGKDDVAVWRSVGASGPGGAYFFILNSADSTVDTIDFGQNGDEAGIVADYDGDGMADPAVYRQPASAPFGQTFFYYKGSAGGGEITFVPWGDNTTEDLRPVRGDFDGDGKADFVVHRTAPGATNGQYVLLRSSDNGVEYINYGLPGDLLFPGDFDGDGLSDFMKVRVTGGAINWYLLERDGGGTGAGFITWGALVSGTSEFAAPGDYDGDGIDDIAVYRRDNSDPDNCYYYILRSSDGMLQLYEFGSTTDTPVQTWDQQF